jgi:pimeloyl-ACP methyl ester carboxylesterase
VLLHGIGSDAETWLPMISALPANTDVIAWDAPGYGSSDPLPESAPAPIHYAERLARFLDTLGIARITLGGHSLGCLFAARFALLHPARVTALALFSPALGYGVPPEDPLPAAQQARIDDLTQLGATAFAANRAPRLIHQPEQKPEILAGVRRAMGAVRMPGYAQAVRALAAGRLLADAIRLKVPTLVAVGAQDVVTPPANARSLHAALGRKLALEIIADAGHALPQEAPVRVAQLITEATHA